jgi:hypothetical protein
VALYDESPLDADILDYLTGYPQGKRQEILRSICRAGFATLVQHKNASEAVIDSLDSDVSSMLIQILSNNTSSGINSRSVSMTERGQPRYESNQNSKARNLSTEQNVMCSQEGVTKREIEAPVERNDNKTPNEGEISSVQDPLDKSCTSDSDIFKGDCFLEKPLNLPSKNNKNDVMKESTSVETSHDADDDIEDPMSKLLLFIDDVF